MDLSEFKNKIKEKEEKLLVVIDDKISSKKITYSVSNEMTLWRAQTLFEKEPITIKWIRSFEKNSIFYDVGANVGMYSIFAAIVSKCNVYSFEPESNNFQILMENIVVNNLTNLINPYPIGISNVTELTTLHLSKFSKGGSHHTVGANALSHRDLHTIKTKYNQGIFSTTLDDLCNKWKIPLPNYLKIDVDGIESKIVEKANLFLKNQHLKSVLIEINQNRNEDKKIIKKMLEYGFIYDVKQVKSAERKSGMHKGYAEYLFFRNS